MVSGWALVLLFALALPSAAEACPRPAGAEVTTYTGGADGIVVQPGMKAVCFEAKGGNGGAGVGTNAIGGLGGYAEGTFALPVGTQLGIGVGANGEVGRGGATNRAAGGVNGSMQYNLGGLGGPYGGGGGAGMSSVWTGNSGASLSDYLLIAGGGGGGGGLAAAAGGRGGSLAGGWGAGGAPTSAAPGAQAGDGGSSAGGGNGGGSGTPSNGYAYGGGGGGGGAGGGGGGGKGRSPSVTSGAGGLGGGVGAAGQDSGPCSDLAQMPYGGDAGGGRFRAGGYTSCYGAGGGGAGAWGGGGAGPGAGGGGGSSYVSPSGTDPVMKDGTGTAFLTVVQIPGEPKLAYDPTSPYDLGTDRTKVVTVKNTGIGNLKLTTASLTGSGFGITENGCNGQTLVTDATCTLRVSYTGPATLAQKSTTLSFTSNDSSAPTLTLTAPADTDTVAPSATISAPTDGAPVRQGGSLTATYACSDNFTVASCVGKVGNTTVPSGGALPTQTAGVQTLTVTATDTSSNTKSSSVTYLVDGADPTATITSPGDGAVVKPGTSLNAAFSCADPGGSGVASCLGRLDGTTPVANGGSLPTAAEGSHTLTVTTADKVGRPGQATRSYVVDGTGPAISLTPATGTFVAKGAALDAHFSCTDPASVSSCTGLLDGTTTVHDGDPLPTASDGSHTLKVDATDGAGNTSSRSVTYLVDGTVPAVALDAPADGRWVAKDATLTADFSCDDTGSGMHTCTGLLDGAKAIADGDPLPTDSEASHTLVVTGTDKVGNHALRSVTYHVDGTDPTASITAPGDAATVKPGATLNAAFACDDPGGSGIDTCVGRLDGTTAVASGDPLPTGSEATHTVSVIATDKAGRTSTATHSYLVDGTGPEISLTPANGTWVAKDAALVADFACIDSAVVESCTGLLDDTTPIEDGDPLPTDADGSHTVKVDATDAAGNPSSKSVTYHVDGTDPVVSIDAPGNAEWVAKDAALTADFSCSDTGGSGVESCSGLLDGETVVADGDPLPTDSEGSHTLVVTGVDEIGNDATGTVTYAVDGTDPTASITTPANGAIVAKDAALAADFTCDDVGGSGIDTCAGKLDGSTVSDGDPLPTATDGFHTLTVKATDKVGRTATASSTYYAGDKPVNTSKPTIGAPKWVAGQTVRADHRGWDNPVGEYHYTWLRCSFSTVASCSPIAGAADDPAYELDSADTGKWIRVKVTAANPAGSADETSASSPKVGVPAVAKAPSISGTTKTGDTLTANTGQWDPVESSVQVRWLRCTTIYLAHCEKITGTADADDLNPTYKLVDDDDAYRIRAQVVARNTTGASAPATSAPTGPVDKPTQVAAPKILASKLRTGDKISTDLGRWTGDPDPALFKVEWLRCPSLYGSTCQKITTEDATDDDAEYTLVDDDDAHHMRVRVTARNASGTSPVALSALTAKVDKPVLKTGPTLTGTAKVGQALTTSRGEWSGEPMDGYTVEWLRCTTIYLAHCAKIDTPDATDNDTTYQVTPDDQGGRIRSRVTARNPSGSSTPATSAVTGKIPAAT